MASENNFEPFEKLTVPLEGSNLIEASAGTGKTYSIAVLVLRLIIEKKIPIKEILMVTFTNAAVAELQERIRLFVRSAYRVCNEEEIEDDFITYLVKRAIKEYTKEKVSERLKDAVLYLDETAVMTIHSFCQQTLLEFAFETNQLFGVELVKDMTDVIENEVNKFWRKYVTSLPAELLAEFGEKLNRSHLIQIVKKHLDAQLYQDYDRNKVYSLGEDDYGVMSRNITESIEEYDKAYEALLEYIKVNKEKLVETTNSNAIARRNVLPQINTDLPQLFWDCIIVKRGSAYIPTLYSKELKMYDDCQKLKTEHEKVILRSLDEIYYLAIQEVSVGVKKYKLQNNQVSFDDLIFNMHAALANRENPNLVRSLQKKYKAVFIDEFQDTDRLQYEIFKTAFGTDADTILFYIGDPKQSIYAWRKADVATYFKAYGDVSEKYEMNENFRSTESFIKAMNLFFQRTPDFDTFYFPPGEQAIQYFNVNSPVPNTKGKFKFNNEECVPITISSLPNNDHIAQAVTAQVIELLSKKKYTIEKNGLSRSIKPSDIGILVRINEQGKKIKQYLSIYGIPAVTIGDAKILQSDEAREVLNVLEAIADITRANINRALLSSFTGYKIPEILLLNDDTVIELFEKYKDNWEKDGIYTALMNFIADFGVQQILLKPDSEKGERIITNLYQLAELLYKTQNTRKLSVLELIAWLKRGIENSDDTGDEFEQRIENDEDCVKIVTIHKSKGLEYNIVLAPYLDFVERKKDEFLSFRNEEGNYVNHKKALISEENANLYGKQGEQENRRLLYVTITRAVYKCFIYRNTHYDTSTLAVFTDAQQEPDPLLINKVLDDDIPQIPPDYIYPFRQTAVEGGALPKVNFNLLHENWTRMSYTMLASEMEKSAKVLSAGEKDKYDQFIFNQLTKGNKTGNLIHYIFENLHFTNKKQWDNVVEKAITRFTPSSKEIYEPRLPEMIEQVLNANIMAGDNSFKLAEVGYDQRIHEFEFDFPVSVFNPDELVSFATTEQKIYVKYYTELEGIMNGKIDMMFAHQNKYFVLDWKSTFLGDTLKNYDQRSLLEAMNENNYHLQYLIYTLAAKKYLQSRLPNFDYEKDFGGVMYLFVRGMRSETNNGIFYCKPSLEQVERLEELLSKNARFQKR